jgi:2-haloacid dehalogenase
VGWVTFDCFGTLIDWEAGFSAILGPLAPDRPQELLRAYHRAEPIVEGEKPHRLYKDVLAEALRRAAEEVGLPPPERNLLSGQWEQLPVFADVEPMLETLRDNGHRLAVLTNCDDDLFARTARLFRAPFDVVVTAERVRDYKPSLTHFRYFADATGANPRDWVHVAASEFHDMVPARHLGLKRVWLDREGAGRGAAGRGSASARVDSAADVAAAVTKLFEQSGGGSVDD